MERRARFRELRLVGRERSARGLLTPGAIGRGLERRHSFGSLTRAVGPIRVETFGLLSSVPTSNSNNPFNIDPGQGRGAQRPPSPPAPRPAPRTLQSSRAPQPRLTGRSALPARAAQARGSGDAPAQRLADPDAPAPRAFTLRESAPAPRSDTLRTSLPASQPRAATTPAPNAPGSTEVARPATTPRPAAARPGTVAFTSGPLQRLVAPRTRAAASSVDMSLEPAEDAAEFTHTSTPAVRTRAAGVASRSGRATAAGALGRALRGGLAADSRPTASTPSMIGGATSNAPVVGMPRLQADAATVVSGDGTLSAALRLVRPQVVGARIATAEAQAIQSRVAASRHAAALRSAAPRATSPRTLQQAPVAQRSAAPRVSDPIQAVAPPAPANPTQSPGPVAASEEAIAPPEPDFRALNQNRARRTPDALRAAWASLPSEEPDAPATGPPARQTQPSAPRPLEAGQPPAASQPATSTPQSPPEPHAAAAEPAPTRGTGPVAAQRIADPAAPELPDSPAAPPRATGATSEPPVRRLAPGAPIEAPRAEPEGAALEAALATRAARRAYPFAGATGVRASQLPSAFTSTVSSVHSPFTDVPVRGIAAAATAANSDAAPTEPVARPRGNAARGVELPRATTPAPRQGSAVPARGSDPAPRTAAAAASGLPLGRAPRSASAVQRLVARRTAPPPIEAARAAFSSASAARAGSPATAAIQRLTPPRSIANAVVPGPSRPATTPATAASRRVGLAGFIGARAASTVTPASLPSPRTHFAAPVPTTTVGGSVLASAPVAGASAAPVRRLGAARIVERATTNGAATARAPHIVTTSPATPRRAARAEAATTVAAVDAATPAARPTPMLLRAITPRPLAAASAPAGSEPGSTAAQRLASPGRPVLLRTDRGISFDAPTPAVGAALRVNAQPEAPVQRLAAAASTPSTASPAAAAASAAPFPAVAAAHAHFAATTARAALPRGAASVMPVSGGLHAALELVAPIRGVSTPEAQPTQPPGAASTLRREASVSATRASLRAAATGESVAGAPMDGSRALPRPAPPVQRLATPQVTATVPREPVGRVTTRGVTRGSAAAVSRIAAPAAARSTRNSPRATLAAHADTSPRPPVASVAPVQRIEAARGLALPRATAADAGYAGITLPTSVRRSASVTTAAALMPTAGASAASSRRVEAVRPPAAMRLARASEAQPLHAASSTLAGARTSSSRMQVAATPVQRLAAPAAASEVASVASARAAEAAGEATPSAAAAAAVSPAAAHARPGTVAAGLLATAAQARTLSGASEVIATPPLDSVRGTSGIVRQPATRAVSEPTAAGRSASRLASRMRDARPFTATRAVATAPARAASADRGASALAANPSEQRLALPSRGITPSRRGAVQESGAVQRLATPDSASSAAPQPAAASARPASAPRRAAGAVGAAASAFGVQARAPMQRAVARLPRMQVADGEVSASLPVAQALASVRGDANSVEAVATSAATPRQDRAGSAGDWLRSPRTNAEPARRALQPAAATAREAGSAQLAQARGVQATRGVVRALPRSTTPAVMADLPVQRMPAVASQPVAPASVPSLSRFSGEPTGTVEGGVTAEELTRQLRRQLDGGSDSSASTTGAAAWVSALPRAELDVTRLPIGGVAGGIAAARSIASDAVRRALSESASERRGSDSFGGGSDGGGVSRGIRSMEMPSRALAAHAARGGGGSRGSSDDGAVQRMSDGNLDVSAPNLGGALQRIEEPEEIEDPQHEPDRSPARRDQQLNDLIDVLQERILAELERRGGRYRGVF